MQAWALTHYPRKKRADTKVSAQEKSINRLFVFLEFFNHDVENIHSTANDTYICNIKDWSIFIFVDSNNITGTDHTRYMLCSTGNTKRKVYLWSYDLT